MDDNDWLVANAGGGLAIAEQYIADGHAADEPISAIGRYLLAIDVMQIHIGRMDAESELVRNTALAAIGAKPRRAEGSEKMTA